MGELEFPSLTTKEISNTVKEIVEQRSPGTHLQQRDHAILKFILEQKFASLEAIYLRFFDKRESQTDPLPKNFWVTRQRISKLRSIGLIKTEKVLSSGKALYLITTAGYKFVKQYSERSGLIQPTTKIDFGLFEHDNKISIVRALTEANGKSKRWYSEKWLKANPIPFGSGQFRFSKDLRPDAVFINSKDERTAFELEVSKKSIKRIREKIYLYKNLIKNAEWEGDRPPVLDKIWIVATSMAVCRKYREAIHEQKYKHKFRVDLYEDVVPLHGLGAAHGIQYEQ